MSAMLRLLFLHSWRSTHRQIPDGDKFQGKVEDMDLALWGSTAWALSEGAEVHDAERMNVKDLGI